MIFNWKQIFCGHIDKTLDSTYLRTERVQDSRMGTIKLYHNYSYYAENKVCLRCGREQIVETRKIDI